MVGMSDPAAPEPERPAAPEPARPETHDPSEPARTGPPANPYASRRPGPVGGRGLAIAAMALGLLALVTAVVSAFYFNVFAVLGALLGVAAVVLGVIALVRRQRRAPGIVGVIGGALALVVAIAVGGLALGALLTPDGPAAQSGSGEGSQSGSGGDAQSEAGDALAWPENFATGGVRFTGDGSGGVRVIESEALADGAAPVPTAADASVGDVQIYLDYRCPYCSLFEHTNADTLDELAASPEVVLEVHPLTFLDRVSAGSAYSSRTAAALACLADAQPDAAWAGHQAMIDPSFQPPESTAGHDDDAIVARLDEAVGLNDEARSCIEQERLVPFAQALNSWVFANPVPRAKDAELKVTGTPFVVVNGVPYAGALDDPAAFRAFLQEQGVPLS